VLHKNSGKCEIDKQKAKDVYTGIKKKISFACDIEILKECGHLDRESASA
jgi:hypothetical protein